MIEYFENEVFAISVEYSDRVSTDEEINEKYRKGEFRAVTDQGRINLLNIVRDFQGENYDMHPEFQRRKRWPQDKKSGLIESLIMNVPIPPIFLYEKDYGKYEIMDGLQRVSTIIDFYLDKFSLKGLKEWSELNGKTYTTLPSVVKNGIDRRQLTTIILLNETAKDETEAIKIKNMVFERLNSGGVKLGAQELRNALHSGKFNDLCKKLSQVPLYKTLWGIKDIEISNEETEDEVYDYYDDYENKSNHDLYKNMGDVEQVLKFFAFRHIEKYGNSLEDFLDDFLEVGNNYTDEILKKYEELFNQSIEIAYNLFKENAFMPYKNKKPAKYIYDPIMQSIMKNREFLNCLNIESDIIEVKFGVFYEENVKNFNGKRNSRSDIKNRIALFDSFFASLGATK